MLPVKQEDKYGCGVACVAFVLKVEYKIALNLFNNGKTRVKKKPNFYCPEVARILRENGLNYKWRRADDRNIKNFDIVFIERSGKFPVGHYLVKYRNKWMDPLSGFVSKIPGNITYVIYH